MCAKRHIFFRTILKMKGGGNLTKQRRAILNVVMSSNGHISADEVFTQVKAALPGIARATVYNNLNYLAEHGLIRRVRIYRQPDLFDRVVEPHDHMICDRCGKVVDVSLGDIEHRLADMTGENITSYELCVHYICGDCREAEQQRKREKYGKRSEQADQ